MSKIPLLISLIVLIPGFVTLAGGSLTDDDLLQIRFEEKVGAQVAPGLIFRNENGDRVRLGDYFQGRPQVLILGYYGCPMLCTLVLNGATECFRNLQWQAGKQYGVIFVSIDPAETPALAQAKKASYMGAYGNVHADTWHFLTGTADSISNLASQVGFRYAYDNTARQYAHPSGLVVLTPDGRVARYFHGINFSAKDLDTALRNAANGANGKGNDDGQFSLLCFHYAPVHGKYGHAILTAVRISGAATVIAVACVIAVQRPRRKRKDLP